MTRLRRLHHFADSEPALPGYLKGCVAVDERDLKKLERELEIKSNCLNRLPFCPDHRDKVAGLPCRECEIERLISMLNRNVRAMDAELARQQRIAYTTKMDKLRAEAEAKLDYAVGETDDDQ